MSTPPRTRLTGLLGYPVEHSLSAAMHNAAFQAVGLDWRYTLHQTAPDKLETMIRRCVEDGYEGWNITVPHKESMVRYLDHTGVEVRATGACNTVRVQDGLLRGYNTDVAGFLAGLDAAGGIEPGSPVVMLGSGGAARAVAWALATAGHNVRVLARNAEQAASLANSLQASAHLDIRYGSLDEATLSSTLDSAALLVNCTPAGMWPHTKVSPLPDGVQLPAHLLVYDLVYRPRPTLLLENAKKAGCRTQDGLAMLVHQGAAAFKIWTGLGAPVEIMKQACLNALQAQD